MSELRRSNRRSHPSLKAREMAPPTKKVRWSKTLNDSAQDPAAEESDDSALDGDGMSPCIKNALYLLPDRAEPNRPWNIYDFVDPAPKFRVVGKGGEKLVDKSPGENASPVPAKGYHPSYMITLVINENYNFMNPSDRSIPCNLDVKGVIFDSDPPDDPRKLELERAVALNGEVRFTINGGYYRVILGFQREIDLALEDEEDTTPCLFRAMYLLRVLSEFGQELVDAPAGSVTPEWRSRVLNPLLQRQLRGIYDHDSDRIEKEVGPSREDAHKFYLTHDPLDYGVGRRLRHNLLYLWQVRWSLGYIDKNGMHHRATSEDYYRTLASTKMLVNHRKVVTEGEAEDMVLSKSEGEVIDEEGIFCYYEDLVREADLMDLVKGIPSPEDDEEMAVDDDDDKGDVEDNRSIPPPDDAVDEREDVQENRSTSAPDDIDQQEGRSTLQAQDQSLSNEEDEHRAPHIPPWLRKTVKLCNLPSPEVVTPPSDLPSSEVVAPPSNQLALRSNHLSPHADTSSIDSSQVYSGSFDLGSPTLDSQELGSLDEHAPIFEPFPFPNLSEASVEFGDRSASEHEIDTFGSC